VTAASPVLSVRDLVVVFDTPAGELVAVDGVSFDVYPDEVLAIVGESGSGKSVTMLAVMGLLPAGAYVRSGSILYRDKNLLELDRAGWRSLRGRDIAMIFQDPLTSLNPVMRIGSQLTKAIGVHAPDLDRRSRTKRAIELLTLVRIPDAARQIRSYPHEFSGGMRQRVMIAMAMAHRPPVLIADEPTTALDVTIQSQVLDVLGRIRDEEKSAMVLITHDLGVVAETADRVVVMYGGRVMEAGTVDEIFDRPRHPYTAGLLASSLSVNTAGQPIRGIPGAPPRLGMLPTGCVFNPRCDVRQGRDECVRDVPPVVPTDNPQHLSSCHFHEEMVRTHPAVLEGTTDSVSH
jgi:oligopeptide/dipeptide ABC transporter ATP-binding protein